VMVELIRPLSRTATILPEPEDVVLVSVPERPVKVLTVTDFGGALV